MTHKVGGVDEFAVLTFLMGRAPRAHGLASWRVLIWRARLVLGFAASEEFRQSFILDREGALHDVLIDTVGVGASPRIAR